MQRLHSCLDACNRTGDCRKPRKSRGTFGIIALRTYLANEHVFDIVLCGYNLKTILFFCFWEGKKKKKIYPLGACGIVKKIQNLKRLFTEKSKTNLTLVFMHSEGRLWGMILSLVKLQK